MTGATIPFRKKAAAFTLCLVLTTSLLSGCEQQQTSPQLANPATTHCLEQGGESELIRDDGGQSRLCTFPDGSQCDEWRYFREECAPGDSLAHQ